MPSDYANDLMARVGLDTTEWKKGITDLNAGLKHIETGFQASAAMMDDWSNNSDGLRKRVDTLNDKLAIQKQKLEMLKKAYEEEVAANGESSKAAEELAKKMYATQNEIKRTQSNIESYTNKLVELGDTAGKVADKLDNYAQKTRTLSMISTAGLAAIGAGLVKAGQNADELNTLAKQTGLTVEEIQKFQYASDLIDVSLDDMTGALRKMTRNMISTSSEVKAAWETLGVATVGANDKSRDAVEVFYELLEALSNVRNETERDQLAMLIFGKSANDLAGIVDDGGKALRELGDEAENLGLIMSQDAVDGANELNDVIDSMKAKTKAAISKAFSENAEKLVPAMESLADTIVSVVNALANMPTWAQKSVVQILAIGAAISPVLSMASKVSKIISTIKKLKLVNSLKQTKTAMDGAAGSTKLAATATSTYSSTLKSAIPVIGLVVIALGKLQQAYNDAKQKIVDGINRKYEAQIEAATTAHDKEVELLNDKLDQVYDIYANETKAAEDAYDETVKKAQEYVDTTKKLLEKEQKLKEKTHKANLERLEEERKAQLALVDEKTTETNLLLQSQIDAIDAEIEAEEKAREEADAARKFKELQTAIDAARTMAEKREAEKELADFVAEQETKKTAAAREEQKKQLQNQIDANNQSAEEQKDVINKKFDDEKKSLEDSYELYQETLEAKTEELESYVESQTQIAQTALDESIATAKEKYQADTENFKNELDEKIEAYEEYIKKLEDEKANAETNPSTKNVIEQFSENTGWKDFYDKIDSAYPLVDIRSLSEEQKEELVKGVMKKHGISREEALKRIGANAQGTNFWRGGLTRINEEGGEILNLPRGTQIIPHDVSMEMARSYGQQAAITNNTTTNNTNNSYNYGTQQQVTVLEVSGQKVASVIQPTVSVGLARSNISRERALGKCR